MRLNPFKKKEADTIVHDITASDLKEEAAIQGLLKAEHLDNRIRWRDDVIVDRLNLLAEMANTLIQKSNRTAQEEELLQKIINEYELLQSRRDNVKAGVGFTGAREDRQMSERYSRMALLMACNEGFDEFNELLAGANYYLTDISFTKDSGAPVSPTMVKTALIVDPRAGHRGGMEAHGTSPEAMAMMGQSMTDLQEKMAKMEKKQK